MPKVKISEFSSTPASNTDIDGINIAEGCAPSGINDAIRELMAQLKDFQTGAVGDSFNGPVGTSTAAAGAFTTLSATGVTTVQAGSAGAPAITTSGDTNTGIFFPAADTIAFSEGGVETARFDSAGNLGLGVTPSAWSTGFGIKALQVGPMGALVGSSSNTNLAHNNYFDGTNVRYINSSPASYYLQADTGAHSWYNAPSGTAGNAISFTQAMTLDASGNLGVGTTSPAARLDVAGSIALSAGNAQGRIRRTTVNGSFGVGIQGNTADTINDTNPGASVVVAGGPITGDAFAGRIDLTAYGNLTDSTSNIITFQRRTGANTTAESARIDSSGNLLVAKTSSTTGSVGFEARANGVLSNTVNSITGVFINRLGNDGSLIDFQQDNTAEGSISVSGTTVSYNGGHLSRWAQMLTKPELLKGTVLSNLDEMNVYTDVDGNPVQNEQLNKVKVSDVEGDANVAGVFVNWSHDDAHDVDEINMAMTGDMIIRIAQGVTVARGDLLMSAGDGTAKPQGDDIVRSKTVAKVTSTHVTCTYADGSYCVPCVLMAC
jgi:hypothetical protein